jgi:hypothetical protein
MGLTITLVVLLLAVGTAGFANWRERRPREVGNPPLISYAAVQMIAVVVALLMAAHLVSLVTGHPLASRYLH